MSQHGRHGELFRRSERMNLYLAVKDDNVVAPGAGRQTGH